MNRRSFLKGLVATGAGILVPAAVSAEPERRIWQLDQTMLARPLLRKGDLIRVVIDEASFDRTLLTVQPLAWTAFGDGEPRLMAFVRPGAFTGPLERFDSYDVVFVNEPPADNGIGLFGHPAYLLERVSFQGSF